MVHCCVPECENHSKKSENRSFHRIPKENATQKAWIARLRRDNLPPLDNCYVCSDHFTEDCFEKNFVVELTGQKIKRRLKLPSLFSFGPPPKQPRVTSVARAKKRADKALTKKVSQVTKI